MVRSEKTVTARSYVDDPGKKFSGTLLPTGGGTVGDPA
jgi:hypothetical protein